jgi:hypothetical protein
MNLNELYYFEGFSNRTYKVCLDNDLDDLLEILSYYREYGNFESLKNCGKKTNQELINLCLNYLEKTPAESNIFSQLDKEKLNFTLIYHFNLLSNRCKNSLENYLKGKVEIENITKKIIYNKSFNISKLRAIGNKSYYEIECFLNKISAIIEENITDLEKSIIIDNYELNNHFSYIIKNLNSSQIEIVNYFIINNFKNLSNKSKNALLLFLDETIDLYKLNDKILSKSNFYYQNIKNVGVNAASELKDFVQLIKDFIKEVSLITNEDELNIFRYRFFIQNTFSISSIPIEILKNESIFNLVDFLINKNAIFKKNENIIFKKTFKIYEKCKVNTLEFISEEIKISKERIRQIRKFITSNLLNSLQFIKNIKDDLYKKYEIDQNQNFINIEEDLNNIINSINKTNFSIEFNTYISYIYISDNFDLIGDIEDILIPRYLNSKESYNWDNFYLVNKKISSLFNFLDFANDLNKRLFERNEESYFFNFKSYLFNFSKSTKLHEINIIAEIAEKILNNEFGLYLDINDNITFTRNTPKQAYEFAYEALKVLGKPSEVNEITKKVIELHPDYKTNDSKIRASLKRKNGFVPIGRRSIFGLKEWEKELENFKGGTIRQIVTEYLNHNSSPQNYSDITSYVLQFRPKTNENSIIQNIKLDESNTFIFFKHSFVGLLSKTYEKTFVSITNSETIEKKSWEERYSELSKFLDLNNRLPFSSGCPENEIKLYRWYNVQLRKIKIGELEKEKSNLIYEINKKFEKSESTQKTSTNIIGRRKKVTSNYKYTNEDLTEFISINRRMPDSRKPNESNLYQFYYRKKKNLENIDVMSAQDEKLVELIGKYISNKHHKYSVDELMEFISIKKRIPDYREPNERSLYQFYYRNKKNLENIDAMSAQDEKFGELIEKFGSYKHHKYTIDELMEFIKINKRMPDSREPKESNLYQFYYRKKKNLENIDSLSAQEEKLVELIGEFGSSKHHKYTIDKLMEFIKINKRMPDSRKPNERGLYQFFYKQRKLFELGKLEQSEENQFIEIPKIILNHMYENKRN